MKVLLVVDGSSHSERAVALVRALQLRPEADISVMTVVPEHTFLGGITLAKLLNNQERRAAQQRKALLLVQSVLKALNDLRGNTESLVRWGNPAEEIIKEAISSGASLIVMGAKGLDDPLTFRLGTTALAVMKHAPTSVLLARDKTLPTNGGAGKEEPPEIKRVLLATDGSRYSDMVTRLILDLPLPPKTEVIIITALQSYLAAWVKTPTLDFQTNQELLGKLRAAEERGARDIMAGVENRFLENGYRTASVVIRGGAAESILAAAKEYRPDIMAVGSRGLSGIKSFLLGSVAERVARYSDCSVLIGRNRGRY